MSKGFFLIRPYKELLIGVINSLDASLKTIADLSTDDNARTEIVDTRQCIAAVLQLIESTLYPEGK